MRHAAHGRATLLVAENEPQHTKLVRPPERSVYGLDALWNDDFITVRWWRSEGTVKPITPTTWGLRKNLFLPPMGLSLPGATLHVATAAAWHSSLRSHASSVCDLSAES